MRVISKVLTYPTPPHATIAYEYAYYTRASGMDKIRLRFLDVSDDIFDQGSLSFSNDNGKTWCDSRPHLVSRKTPEGTLRGFEGLGWVDPVNGRLVTLYLVGLFRKDSSQEGMTQYYLNYRVSEDGGRSSIVDEQAIQKGTAYSPQHPFENVWVGRNCVSMPAIPPLVRTRQGHLVASVMMSVPGPDGKLMNPGGGFTWLEELILFGRWQADGHMEWESGPRLALPPEKSTRGLDESALTEMPDGRLLLVMRGSNGGQNDPEGKIPGYKWFSVSPDAGLHWTEPQPWGYADGTLFHSPASMNQIVRHSSGKYYWFGNISPQNPNGNEPRYPLVAGEIDTVSGKLIRESLFEVDTLQPGEPVELQLSNFYVQEDRADGCLLLYIPRFIPRGKWVGDTYVYRIEV